MRPHSVLIGALAVLYRGRPGRAGSGLAAPRRPASGARMAKPGRAGRTGPGCHHAHWRGARGPARGGPLAGPLPVRKRRPRRAGKGLYRDVIMD